MLQAKRRYLSLRQGRCIAESIERIVSEGRLCAQIATFACLVMLEKLRRLCYTGNVSGVDYAYAQ